MEKVAQKEELLVTANQDKQYLDSLIQEEKIEIMETALRKNDIRTVEMRFLVRDGTLSILGDIIPKALLVKAFEFDGGKYSSEIEATVLVTTDQADHQDKLKELLTDKVNDLNNLVIDYSFRNWKMETYSFSVKYRDW